MQPNMTNIYSTFGKYTLVYRRVWNYTGAGPASKIRPKIDTFIKIGKIDIRDLTIFGAKKVVFGTFWKLVLSCSKFV